MIRLGRTRGVETGQVVVGRNPLKLGPLFFKMELFPLFPETLVKFTGLIMGEFRPTGSVGFQVIGQRAGGIRIKQANTSGSSKFSGDASSTSASSTTGSSSLSAAASSDASGAGSTGSSVDNASSSGSSMDGVSSTVSSAADSVSGGSAGAASTASSSATSAPAPSSDASPCRTSPGCAHDGRTGRVLLQSSLILVEKKRLITGNTGKYVRKLRHQIIC